jgi:organic radical activating enzyme
VIVKRENSGWVVICEGGEPVRHRLLDVALIEAVRRDVEVHWSGSNPARWASRTADDIASPWRNKNDERGDAAKA